MTQFSSNCRGQRLYVVQAALEHLVSLLVSGSFLATLTRELGFSDSLTGILSAVISLGCLFQLLSVFLRRRVKTVVVVFSAVNQILFLLLYVIPLGGGGKPLKTTAFVVLILLAYLIYNWIHPKKFNWLMSTVDNARRGTFTAGKEIVSLVAGIAFSFGMGTLVDRLSAAGNIKTAFALCAVVLAVLMVGHTLSLVFVPEKDDTSSPRSLKKSMHLLVHNTALRRTIVVSALYNIAAFSARPFFGSYEIKELGMSLGLISLLSMAGSVSRIAVSHLWGRYADRRSFAAMIEKCLLVLDLAWLCVMLATPANGMWMFLGYYVLNGIAMGGINSAQANLIYDCVPRSECADALAISYAITGVAGFATTLGVSPLVDRIQQNGNTLFGLPIYAQQVMVALALAVTVIAVIYTRVALIRSKAVKGVEK